MNYNIFYANIDGRSIFIGREKSKKKAEDKIISLLSKYYVDFIYVVRSDDKFFALAQNGKLKEISKEAYENI